MRLAITLGLVLSAVVSFYAAVLLASESGEVVTLTTMDAAEQRHETRLWVVEYDGAEWVRTGHPEKGWFRRLRSNPEVVFGRRGVISRRMSVAVLDPAVVKGVNEVFAQKYGATDWIVALSGDASKRVPVRLDRVAP